MFLSTWQTLYRVPDKWHTAKNLFADAYLPCAICRVQHTAKALTCVKEPLPCASSTRQTGRLR